MTKFYNEQTPVIENGKLVFVSNGGSREVIGIRAAKAQLKDLEAKAEAQILADSTVARLELLRAGVALHAAQ